MAWTAPDPLILDSKTRSIYITELQDAANVKRIEIGQLSHVFISQILGETFKLSAIEELKTIINTLAEDFGYVGGVTNIALLGRDYVDITIKYGNRVCHFPIINDLRQVLNVLEFRDYKLIWQVAKFDGPTFIDYQYVETSNYDNGFTVNFVSAERYTESTISIVSDDSFIYMVNNFRPNTFFRLNRSDFSLDISVPAPMNIKYLPVDMFVDKDNVWVLTHDTTTSGESWVFKLDKDFNIVGSEHIGSSETILEPAIGIVVDKEHVYVTGIEAMDNTSTPTPIVVQFNKDFSGGQNIKFVRFKSGSIAFTMYRPYIDETYAYYDCRESVSVPIQQYQVVKIRLSDFTITHELRTIQSLRDKTMSDDSLLYEARGSGFVRVWNKSNIVIKESAVIDAGDDYTYVRSVDPASYFEYSIT